MLFFYEDNKYQTPPPYGESGVISLVEADLERKNLIFLIDGWLLTDARVTNKPTYIGEFSNLQREDLAVLPHGQARYQLTLRYDGAERIVSVDFPQLYSEYTILLDGTCLAQGKGSERITFLLTAGEHILVVETSSKLGYYSGMYFPPALGTTETLFQAGSVQSFAYALAFLIPLVLAVFTLFLWRAGGRLARWFGVLCCSYVLYMARYFVFLLSYFVFLPIVQYWFLIQSLAMYCQCFCVMQLTVLASGVVCSKAWRWARVFLLMLLTVLMMLGLLVSVLPWAVFVHGRLTDFYYIVTFCVVAFFIVRNVTAQSWESCYVLVGCTIFRVGLLANLFFSNRFEPIRFFWQFEWCGLLLVLLFGAMMVSRNRRILKENDVLTNYLEEQIKERTEEVTQLLNERKAFFSDMAHELTLYSIIMHNCFVQGKEGQGYFMIKVAFCDDDMSVLGELKSLLDQYCTKHSHEIDHTVFYSSLELLIEIEKGVRYDILFLDIILPNENGINIAKEIRQYDSVVKIIFLTSSSEFAVQSYTVGAYFYQMKPIWEENFFRLMDSAISECQKEQQHSLILRCKSEITRIDLDRLEYCEVFGRTLMFHMENGKVLEGTGSMDKLYGQLSQYENFVRPHRSFLINMEYVRKISCKAITMENMKEIPIPHGKCCEIKNLYLEYAFNRKQVFLL